MTDDKILEELHSIAKNKGRCPVQADCESCVLGIVYSGDRTSGGDKICQTDDTSLKHAKQKIHEIVEKALLND